MSAEFGYIEAKIGHHVDFSFPILEEGVPCACRCLIYNITQSSSLTRGRRVILSHCSCKQEVVNY
jgi:hypothetical protein